MRVDVVGPGAIGGTLAALLAEAGEDVAVVGRGEHARAIAERGLRLRRGDEVLTARPTVLDATRPHADLVLLAVKTQDVADAARRVARGPGAVLVLANGLDADRLAAALLPGRRVAPAVVVFDAEHLAPGEVALHRPGSLVLSPEAPAEADVLGRVVLLERRADFHGVRWTKLLINLGNGVNAATGLAARDAFRGPGARVGLRAIKEGLAVADARGVSLARTPWANPALFRLLARLPEPLAAAALTQKVRRTFRGPPVYGSTLQSLKRGRPTEARWLNGAIVDLGRRSGVPVPANETILAAVERAEKGGGFTDAAELWASIRRS